MTADRLAAIILSTAIVAAAVQAVSGRMAPAVLSALACGLCLSLLAARDLWGSE
jgi:hypothetical protein